MDGQSVYAIEPGRNADDLTKGIEDTAGYSSVNRGAAAGASVHPAGFLGPINQIVAVPLAQQLHTTAHEVGHLLQLEHPKDAAGNNIKDLLMTETVVDNPNWSTRLTKAEWDAITW